MGGSQSNYDSEAEKRRREEAEKLRLEEAEKLRREEAEKLRREEAEKHYMEAEIRFMDFPILASEAEIRFMEAEKRRLEERRRLRRELEVEIRKGFQEFRREAEIPPPQRVVTEQDFEEYRKGRRRLRKDLQEYDDDGGDEAPRPPPQRVVTEQEAEKHRMEAEKRFMEAEKRFMERRRLRKAAPRPPPQRLVTEQGFEESDSGTESSTGEAEMFAEERRRHRRKPVSFAEKPVSYRMKPVSFAEGFEEWLMGVSSHEFKLIGSSKTEYPSSAATLSCNLSPELSAVDLEIRWFKETECVYLYKNRQVTEGKGYEDRVSLFRDELEKGNVSLQLKNCSWSDLGDYLCQVTDGDTTEELTVRITGGSHEAEKPPPQRVFTEQIYRQWTNEEKLKLEKSSLSIEHNSLLSEFKEKSSNLEKTQEELKNPKLELEQVMETNQNKLERLEKELQDKNSQIQDMIIRQLQEKDRQLQEKDRQLQEKDKQLQEKDKQLQEKDKQLQEKDKQLQEKLQERTDPDPSVPIRRRNSIDSPPYMSGESSGDLEMEKPQQRLSDLTQTHSGLEEVYGTTVKSTAEAEGAAPVEQSIEITQKVIGLFR